MFWKKVDILNLSLLLKFCCKFMTPQYILRFLAWLASKELLCPPRLRYIHTPPFFSGEGERGTGFKDVFLGLIQRICFGKGPNPQQGFAFYGSCVRSSTFLVHSYKKNDKNYKLKKGKQANILLTCNANAKKWIKNNLKINCTVKALFQK